LNKQKLVAMAMFLEQAQPYFTAIIYTRKSTDLFETIGRLLSEIIGLKEIVKTGSSFGS